MSNRNGWRSHGTFLVPHKACHLLTRTVAECNCRSHILPAGEVGVVCIIKQRVPHCRTFSKLNSCKNSLHEFNSLRNLASHFICRAHVCRALILYFPSLIHYCMLWTCTSLYSRKPAFSASEAVHLQHPTLKVKNMPDFYGCYLLESQSKERSRKNYIGYGMLSPRHLKNSHVVFVRFTC